MSDVNSSILKLARDICAGRSNVKRTTITIQRLEAKYGDWDMPVMLPDGSNMTPEQYLDSLASTVNSGVFSKEALLRMAELSESMGKNRGHIRFIKPLLICIIIGFLLIMGVLVIILVGGAK